MPRILFCTITLLCLTGCASGTSETPPVVSGTTVSAASVGDSDQHVPAASALPSGITSEEAAAIAPLAPAQLSAAVVAGGVRLTWYATGEDLTGYICLRRPTASPQWTVVERLAAEHTTLLDPQPAAGEYVYAVQAIGVNGRSSPMTQSAVVIVR